MRTLLLSSLLLTPSLASSIISFLDSVHHSTSLAPASSRLEVEATPAGNTTVLECRAQGVLDTCTWSREGVEVPPTSMAAASCSLSLETSVVKDLGSWTCRATTRGATTFREATVHTTEGRSRLSDVRLPTHLRPISYNIYALPFLIPDNWTVAGMVEITLEVAEAADNITLHIADMEVQEDAVTVEGAEGFVPVVGHGYDEARQFYILHLGEQLQANTSILVTIPYTGHLNADLVGFYRSSYQDPETGEPHWLAVTQFETTDARRAFPCLDEPILKAKFRTHLARLPGMSSISNMPIQDEGVPLDGLEYVLDIYEESLQMSTYLVAFVVSDFVYRESEPLENGVRFRIWSQPAYFAQTEYAAAIGPRILQFYESYFNTSFPLPKQDMVAVPDFGAGAMENWGLITYREYALLYEEGGGRFINKWSLIISH